MRNRRLWKGVVVCCAVLATAAVLASCKGEKKIVQYSQMYKETPAVIYIAPINDLSSRRALRELNDSAYNASLNTAVKHCYLTAASPLVNRGYYVMGPLASAQLSATESRTGKQLRNESIEDLYTGLGIDAVLFVDIVEWTNTHAAWTVEAEYYVRSARTGGELLFAHVKATKLLPTDHKGNPKPLKADQDFAERYGCDLETAQRCRLVEILNEYVLSDLPSGSRARVDETERYVKSHPEYFNLRIHRDGSVEMLKSTEEGN